MVIMEKSETSVLHGFDIMIPQKMLTQNFVFTVLFEPMKPLM